MHRRKVFAVLILCSSLVGFRFQSRENLNFGGTDSSSLSQAKTPVGTLQIVDSWMDTLPVSLQKISSPERRLSYVQETLHEIEKLRKARGYQGVRQEIQIDFYVEPLKMITVSQKYDPTHCPEWRHRLVADYAPIESGEVYHPQLKKVERVIASVCQGR